MQSKILKWLGFPLVALCLLVVCLKISFPTSFAMGLIEDQLVNVEDWDVKADRAFLLIPGIGAKRVTITRKSEITSPAASETTELGGKNDRATNSANTTTAKPVSASSAKTAGTVAAKSSIDPDNPEAANDNSETNSEKDKKTRKKKKKRYPKIRIDDLRVKIAVFPLLIGKKRVKIYASGVGIKDGSFSFVVNPDKKTWSVDGEAENIDLMELSKLFAPPVPIKGILQSASIDLDNSEEKSARSSGKSINGSIVANIDKLIIGDGVEKLKLARSTNPMLKAGITLPELPIETLTIDIPVKSGVAALSKVKSTGKQLKLSLSGDAHLRFPINGTSLSSFVELFISSELKNSNPVFDLLTLALNEGKMSDESYGIKIDGSLRRPSVRPSKTKPSSRSKKRSKDRSSDKAKDKAS